MKTEEKTTTMSARFLAIITVHHRSLTCSNLIFIVKSPTIILSLMSLGIQEINRHYDYHTETELSKLQEHRRPI